MKIKDVIEKIKNIFSKKPKELPAGMTEQKITETVEKLATEAPEQAENKQNEFITKLQEETKKGIEDQKKEKEQAELASAKTPEEVKMCILKQAGVNEKFLNKRLVREKLFSQLDDLIDKKTGLQYAMAGKFSDEQKKINPNLGKELKQEYTVNDIHDVDELRNNAENIVSAVNHYWKRTDDGLNIVEPLKDGSRGAEQKEMQLNYDWTRDHDSVVVTESKSSAEKTRR